jgi:hypothetical protein
MRRGRRVRGGLGLAAVTVAFAAAACAAPAGPAPAPPSAAKLALSPMSLSFPDGSSTFMPNLSATVTNTGGQTAQSLAVSTTNGVYSLPTNTCTTTLAPGQSCMVTVQFCPGAVPGPFPANLMVTAMSGGSPVSVSDPMSGQGAGT